MHNKSICNVSSYNWSNNSANFKTAHKHTACTMPQKVLVLICYKYFTHCAYSVSYTPVPISGICTEKLTIATEDFRHSGSLQVGLLNKIKHKGSNAPFLGSQSVDKRSGRVSDSSDWHQQWHSAIWKLWIASNSAFHWYCARCKLSRSNWLI